MADSLLDDKEELYINWLLTPEKDREPATKKDFAEQVVHVHPGTLHDWEKRLHFQREYERRWRKLRGSPESVERVVAKLHEKALDGDVRSMQLYLEWAREMGRNASPADDEPEGLRNMPDEELAALAVELTT